MSRLVDGKGVDELIDAIPYVLKEHKNVIFLFAGKGEKGAPVREGSTPHSLDPPNRIRAVFAHSE